MNARVLTAGVLALAGLAAVPVHGQISSVTRRTLQAPAAITVVRQTNTAAAPVMLLPPAPRAVTPPSAPKSEGEKAEEQKRVIAFQKKCAEQGMATFQCDLGLRYLNGDGVEPDPEAARKWLSLAAKQGNQRARKKLDELDKTPPQAP